MGNTGHTIIQEEQQPDAHSQSSGGCRLECTAVRRLHTSDSDDMPAREQGTAAKVLKLSNGHEMPAVGLGVWRMDAPAIRGLIHSAIRAGYRHFDCAGTRTPSRSPLSTLFT